MSGCFCFRIIIICRWFAVLSLILNRSFLLTCHFLWLNLIISRLWSTWLLSIIKWALRGQIISHNSHTQFTPISTTVIVNIIIPSCNISNPIWFIIYQLIASYSWTMIQLLFSSQRTFLNRFVLAMLLYFSTHLFLRRRSSFWSFFLAS